MNPFTDRMRSIAVAQARHVSAATTVEEREHYMAELRRFEALANMTEAEARRAYRPARAYEPKAG